MNYSTDLVLFYFPIIYNQEKNKKASDYSDPNSEITILNIRSDLIDFKISVRSDIFFCRINDYQMCFLNSFFEIIDYFKLGEYSRNARLN